MVSEAEVIKMDMQCIKQTNYSKFAKEFNKQHYIFSTKFDTSRATIQRSKKALINKLSQDGFNGTLKSTGRFITHLGENVIVIYNSEEFTHEQADKLLTELNTI